MSKEPVSKAGESKAPASSGGKNKLLYSLGTVKIGNKEVPTALIVGGIVIVVGLYVGFKSGFKGLGDSEDGGDGGLSDDPVFPPGGGGGGSVTPTPTPLDPIIPTVPLPTTPVSPLQPVPSIIGLQDTPIPGVGLSWNAVMAQPIPGQGLTGTQLIDLWNPLPANDYRPGGQQALESNPQWEGNTSDYVWISPYSNWEYRLRDGSSQLSKVKKSDLPANVTLTGTYAGGGNPLPVYTIRL